MKTSERGALLAAAAAALLLAGGVSAYATDKAGGEVRCVGINSCKGKGTCAGAGNSCQGMNACKGKGIVPAPNAEECVKLGGKVVAADPKM